MKRKKNVPRLNMSHENIHNNQQFHVFTAVTHIYMQNVLQKPHKPLKN